MYELKQVSENCYFIQSPAKIGLVKTGFKDEEGAEEVVLIDSGSDKDAGRKVKQHLEANGWKLTAIYNTHSNADHIGGNAFLQSRTGCRIFAPGIDCDFTRHPLLEPAFLYGGFPPDEIRHKFLMAQASEADDLLMEDRLTDSDNSQRGFGRVPDGWEIIPLPGHFFDMVGFRTPDDVVYLADCLFSRETLDKYAVSFIYDVGAFIKTLEKVSEMEARVFIPSHAAATDDIAPLARYNIQKVNEIGDLIVRICETPSNWEQILKLVFDEYELELSWEQYVLVGSTVRSYLTWLKGEGRLESVFDSNTMLWRRA